VCEPGQKRLARSVPTFLSAHGHGEEARGMEVGKPGGSGRLQALFGRFLPPVCTAPSPVIEALLAIVMVFVRPLYKHSIFSLLLHFEPDWEHRTAPPSGREMNKENRGIVHRWSATGRGRQQTVGGKPVTQALPDADSVWPGCRCSHVLCEG
jgi:hypothetical protein